MRILIFLFFGPPNFWISRSPDLQISEFPGPQISKFSDLQIPRFPGWQISRRRRRRRRRRPNSQIPTQLGIKYVARALASMMLTRLGLSLNCDTLLGNVKRCSSDMSVRGSCEVDQQKQKEKYNFVSIFLGGPMGPIHPVWALAAIHPRWGNR